MLPPSADLADVMVIGETKTNPTAIHQTRNRFLLASYQYALQQMLQTAETLRKQVIHGS